MIHGTIRHRGSWLIQAWDAAPPTDPDVLLRAYHEGRGRLIQNIITNTGLQEMAKRNLGLSSTSNNKILLGSANTPTPQAAQTSLTAQTGSVNVSSRTLEGTVERYLATITSGSVGSNKNIGELGLAANAILISRVVVNPRLLLSPTKTYTTMSLIVNSAG